MKKLLITFLTIFVFVQASYAMEIDNNTPEETVFEQQKTYKKLPWYKRATFKRDLMMVSGLIISLSVINMHTGFFSLHLKFDEAIKKEIEALKKYKVDCAKYKEKLEENQRIQKDKAALDNFLKNHKPAKGVEHKCATCWETFAADDVVFFPCKCVMNSENVVCRGCKFAYEERKRNVCMHCGQAYMIEENCNDLKKPLSLTPRSLFISYIAQLFV